MASLWPWLRLPFYLSAAAVSFGGGALYYFQKYADRSDVVTESNV